VSWLAALPHQIPFRAASTGRRIDDRTIEGEYLCTANDPGQTALMLGEAMAQLAGGLAFHAAPGRHGFLSGIDRFELDRGVDAGDVVRIVVRLEAELGGLFRFAATGTLDGVEVARGRFYLADPHHANA
jgi:3-hydroxymyristoyl/3-hydroxydecanoyl-(acyl carrier protein) dehydratase